MQLPDLRFLLALTAPIAPIVGYRIGDNYHAFFVFFIIIPVLDWLTDCYLNHLQSHADG